MIHFDPETHTYTVDGTVYPGVTKILGEAGLYGDAARWFNTYSRDRGTAVHRAVELYLNDRLDPDYHDEVVLGYLAGYKAFEANTGFYPAYIETPMYHHGIKVAGTPDLIGPYWKESRPALIDIKTGGQSPVTGIQTAAYEYIWKPKTNDHVARFGLYLRQDGKYHLVPYKDRQDREVWKALVMAHNWKRENLK